MKILFFFSSFNVGGVERVMITVANYLQLKGHEVYIIVTRNYGELKSELDQKIQVISLDRTLRRCGLALKKHIDKINPDIVMSGPDFPNFILILISFFLKRKTKIICTQHNFYNIESKQLGWYGRLTPYLYRFLYRSPNGIIAVSEEIRSMLKTYGIEDSRISKIYNPLDIQRIRKMAILSLNIPVNKEYIVFVGRLSVVKNVPLLLKAFKQFYEKNGSIDLVIIGDGEERISLERISYDLGISEKVLFTGSLKNPYPIIANSKMLVLPSFSECFPCTLLEAMALGVTPVITKNKGNMETSGEGKYAYVCKSFIDADELCQCMTKAYHHPLAPELLRNRAAMFDVDKIGQEYERLILNYINSAKITDDIEN